MELLLEDLISVEELELEELLLELLGISVKPSAVQVICRLLVVGVPSGATLKTTLSPLEILISVV